MKLLRTISTLLAGPKGLKGKAELAYWGYKRVREGPLSHAHYRYFYTTHFGLTEAFYADKRVLDVGCGPRGSLEWADGAAERVGLDPLAGPYRALGVGRHRMRYVAAPSERMPFADASFDVVSSFNSLDHVDDVERTAREICRVLAPGGLFLLLTDVGHAPTITEPRSFSWDVVECFAPPLRLVEARHFEKAVPHALYDSLRAAVPYDHADPARRYGVLSAKLAREG